MFFINIFYICSLKLKLDLCILDEFSNYKTDHGWSLIMSWQFQTLYIYIYIYI